MATVNIPKPQNESDCANLYQTVVSLLETIDPDIDDYMQEANICDDSEIDQIVAVLASYYEETRQKVLRIEGDEEKVWKLRLEDT